MSNKLSCTLRPDPQCQRLGAGTGGRERTVGAVGGRVQEEEGLVYDAAARAARADEAAHNARRAAGYEGHHPVRGAAAALQQPEEALSLRPQATPVERRDTNGTTPCVAPQLPCSSQRRQGLAAGPAAQQGVCCT